MGTGVPDEETTGNGEGVLPIEVKVFGEEYVQIGTGGQRKGAGVEAERLGKMATDELVEGAEVMGPAAAPAEPIRY
jgi:hypothetical protein